MEYIHIHTRWSSTPMPHDIHTAYHSSEAIHFSSAYPIRFLMQDSTIRIWLKYTFMSISSDAHEASGNFFRFCRRLHENIQVYTFLAILHISYIQNELNINTTTMYFTNNTTQDLTINQYYVPYIVYNINRRLFIYVILCIYIHNTL